MKLLGILITGLFLTSIGAIAQNTAQRGTGSVPVITKDSPTGKPIDPNAVEAFTKKIEGFIEKDLENYQESSYMQYAFRVRELQKWLNYRFLEVDSEIDTRWFKQLYELLNLLYQTKREHDLSSMPENSKFRTENKNKFELAVQRFKVLIKKPTKANPQRVKYLKREKQKYLKEKNAAAKNKAKR